MPALQNLGVEFAGAGEAVEFFVGAEFGGVVGGQKVVAGFLAVVGEEGRHECVFRGLDGRGEFGAFAEKFAVGGRGLVEWGEEGFFDGFFGGGEDAVERVVIARGDRIEFVIVAAGAGDGEAEEAARDDVDAVVDDVVLVAEEAAAEGEKAHGGEGGFVFAERELVGGELFDEKLVEGQIGVEGADDVVAVGVREGEAAFGVADEVALGVGVAGDVEPEAAPAFAVAGGGEEAVDGAGVGVGRAVGEEGGDFGGRRGEACQVIGDTAQERAGVGGGGGREAGGGEFGVDEGVDRIAGGRRRSRRQREEGPVLAGAGHVEGEGGNGAGAGIGGAEADPVLEGGDFFGGEFAAVAVFARRHLEVFVGEADGLDEEALVGIAGDESGAGRAAFAEGVAGVEGEAAFGFALGGVVAGVAGLDENGADGGFEEFDFGGWEGGGWGGGERGGGGEEEGEGDAGKRGAGRWRAAGGGRERPGAARRAMTKGWVHAMRSLTTLPWTSVRRKSRPAWR